MLKYLELNSTSLPLDSHEVVHDHTKEKKQEVWEPHRNNMIGGCFLLDI